MHRYQQVLIGDGYSTSWMAHFLAQNLSDDKKILWITGSGSRLLPTQYGVVSIWSDPNENAQQSQSRIFRNKAFREFNAETDLTWNGESRLTFQQGLSLEQSSFEVFETIRREALALFDESENCSRIESNVRSVVTKDGGTEITLADGQVLWAEKVTYADRWSALSSIDGLPRPFVGVRGRESFSVLQAIFHHDRSLGIDLKQTFISSLSKEAGEASERHLFGYFNSMGNQSFWTIALSAEETEDNHLIGKRLRRMKQALNKMFASLLNNGEAEEFQFVNTITSERVRLDEHALFSGDFPAPGVYLPKTGLGIEFVSEEFGWDAMQTQLTDWTTRRLAEVQSLGTIPQDASVDAIESQLQ